MRLITKKIILMLLMSAFLGSSTLALSASPFHICEESSAEQAEIMDVPGCHSQIESQYCHCNDCDGGCVSHFVAQTIILAEFSDFQDGYLHIEIASLLQQSYTQHFHNPLLRPPII